MIRVTARIICAALLLTLAGCGARPSAAGNTSNRTVLTSEEIAKAGYSDAYMTVQSLRPQWLQKRGVTSSAGQSIKVYLDGMRLGAPETLRQISAQSIASIRYLSGLEASERYGLDHDMGAIVVITRR